MIAEAMIPREGPIVSVGRSVCGSLITAIGSCAKDTESQTSCTFAVILAGDLRHLLVTQCQLMCAKSQSLGHPLCWPIVRVVHLLMPLAGRVRAAFERVVLQLLVPFEYSSYAPLGLCFPLWLERVCCGRLSILDSLISMEELVTKASRSTSFG